jgi:hypothetical protein
MIDEESKVSYSDISEIMKHNILPKASQIERQNKVMYYLIFSLLGLSISGIILWFIYKQ